MDLNQTFGHLSSSDDDLQFLTMFMAPADIVPERPGFYAERGDEEVPGPSKTEIPPRRGRGPGKKNKKNEGKDAVEPPKKQRKARQKKRVGLDSPQTPATMKIETVEVPERYPSPPPPLPALNLPPPNKQAPLLKHKCRFCPRRCAQPAQMIRHETIHMRGEDKPIHICPYCEAPYAFPMTLNHHIRTDHPGKAKYDY